MMIQKFLGNPRIIFVDKKKGKDSYSGKSQDKAKKTIAAARAIVEKPHSKWPCKEFLIALNNFLILKSSKTYNSYYIETDNPHVKIDAKIITHCPFCGRELK